MLFFLKISAQDNTEFKPSGKTFGTVFTNFSGILSEGDHASSFEITRAYLGHKYQMDENFSATVKLDIGSINDESQYALIRRYSYFKNAFLDYKKNKLCMQFGLIDLYQFKTTEEFWSHRYVYKTFQDQHKMGSSADLGVGVKYNFTEKISADGSFFNGEGYKDLQADNTYEGAVGVTIKPIKGLTIRGYGDLAIKNVSKYTLVGFAGYKFKEKATAGIEYSYQSHNKFNENNNYGGVSAFLMANVYKKWEVFGRYDMISSNKVFETDFNPWNYSKDGQLIIGGVQYAPREYVRFSANITHNLPDNPDNDKITAINIDLEFKF
ncbi:MAG TPA: porin [Bacteroidales bacterium]|nr:porin [Bacteroidales bacterium]